MHSHKLKTGLSVVEIIVASAILLTLVTAIGGGWQLYLRVVRDGTNYTMASNLSEEGAEAIQLMRDNRWTTNIAPLSLNIEYDLYWNGTAYKATTTPQLLQNMYRRTVTFSSIDRDAWSNIVTSGGTLDPNTRKVDIKIYLGNSTSTALTQSQILIHNTYAN
jgi:hypothetical protein